MKDIKDLTAPLKAVLFAYEQAKYGVDHDAGRVTHYERALAGARSDLAEAEADASVLADFLRENGVDDPDSFISVRLSNAA